MRKKKADPPEIPEIIEATQTVYKVGEEVYHSRAEAERIVLRQKIYYLMDTGDDSLNETDLYKDEIIDWIIDHYDDLIALPSTYGG